MEKGTQPYRFDWGWDGDRYFIYKSRTRVGRNLMFLFSPFNGGTQLAAQALLDEYWSLARRLKEKEFLRVYRAGGEVWEHVYK